MEAHGPLPGVHDREECAAPQQSAHRGGGLRPGELKTELRVEPAQHRQLQRDLPVLRGQAGQHPVGELVGEAGVERGQLGAPGARRGGSTIGRHQRHAHADGPAVQAAVERGGVLRREGGVDGRGDGDRLVVAQPQILLDDLDQPVRGPPPRQGEPRSRAGGDHQPQRVAGSLRQMRDPAQHQRIGVLVQAVDDEAHRRAAAQLSHERIEEERVARAAFVQKPRRLLVDSRAGAAHRGDDLAPDQGGIPAEGLHGRPSGGHRRGVEPLAGGDGLAESRQRGDQRDAGDADAREDPRTAEESRRRPRVGSGRDSRAALGSRCVAGAWHGRIV